MSERKEIDCILRGTEDIDGHQYREVERHESGCGVSVLKCEHCGKYSVSWWREDTPPAKGVSDIPEACPDCGERWPKHKDYCGEARHG